jgi:hypothetical protein
VFAAVLLLFFCISLSVPALAASEADSMRVEAVVSPDGRCNITVTMSLRLESSVPQLLYPIPENATDVTVNGVATRPTREGALRMVDLKEVTGGYAGLYTITIHYTLRDVVVPEEEKIYVVIPLLSGFTYPIRSMEFSITLPGDVALRPSFVSGYYQESIESDLAFQTSGSNISGHLEIPLKDRETLSFSLQVPEDMFPRSVTVKYDNSMGILAMVIFLVLALAYYLVTMCPAFPFPHRTPNPPVGVSAGEVASYLCGSGISLSMLVLSWGQMGYLRIQPEKSGKVLLHKCMEMGNERSSFENRCFRDLFAMRTTVDATGIRWAALQRKLQGKCPAARDIFRRESGNPMIFRGLSALVGLSGGIAMALSLVQEPVARILLSILFGSLCGASSWLIQEGCMRLLLRDPIRKLLSLAGAVVILIVSIISHQILLALVVILLEFIAGIATAVGGRRTELGKQMLSQILGLRRFLQLGKDDQMQQILRFNPDYYFDLLPYAMALGVDKAFSKKLGNLRLSPCPYLITVSGHLSAEQWRRLLLQTVQAMESSGRPDPENAAKKRKPKKKSHKNAK